MAQAKLKAIYECYAAPAETITFEQLCADALRGYFGGGKVESICRHGIDWGPR